MACGHPSRGRVERSRIEIPRMDEGGRTASLSSALLPRQLVARVEPGDVLREEGVALGLEGLRRIERVQVQVDLARAPRGLVADRRSTARAMASRDTGRGLVRRPVAAERDVGELEVHEAG